jgi:uncharacterized protein YecT (DUF1311 family)
VLRRLCRRRFFPYAMVMRSSALFVAAIVTAFAMPPTVANAQVGRFEYDFRQSPEEEPPDPAVWGRISPAFLDCQNAAGPTFEIAACFESEFARQDDKLNRVWRQVLTRVARHDRNALIHAERAWAGARDPFCRSEADAYKGGTIQPIIYSSCRVEQTIRRTIWLEALQ